MRLLTLALVACTLLVVVPVNAAPGSGADCDVQEEYVLDAQVTADPHNLDPNNLVQPGAPRPIECYY